MANGREAPKKGFSGLEALASDVVEKPFVAHAVEAHERNFAVNVGSTTAGQPVTAETKPKRSGPAWAIVPILFVLVIVVYQMRPETGSNSSSNAWTPTVTNVPSSRSSPTPDQTYAAQPTRNNAGVSSDRRWFQIPSYMKAQLDAESADVDAAQREADRLASQVRYARINLDAKQEEAQRVRLNLQQLGAELESERTHISSSSEQQEIDAFNLKVEQYNMMLVRARRITDEANSLVDPFNALVNRSNRQLDLANQKVDAYNQKLQQFGTQVSSGN